MWELMKKAWCSFTGHIPEAVEVPAGLDLRCKCGEHWTFES